MPNENPTLNSLAAAQPKESVASELPPKQKPSVALVKAESEAMRGMYKEIGVDVVE